jgi:hypothetical protein
VGPVGIGLLTQLFGIRIGFVTCGVVALLLLIPLITSHRFSLRGAGSVNPSAQSSRRNRRADVTKH